MAFNLTKKEIANVLIVGGLAFLMQELDGTVLSFSTNPPKMLHKKEELEKGEYELIELFLFLKNTLYYSPKDWKYNLNLYNKAIEALGYEAIGSNILISLYSIEAGVQSPIIKRRVLDTVDEIIPMFEKINEDKQEIIRLSAWVADNIERVLMDLPVLDTNIREALLKNPKTLIDVIVKKNKTI